MSKPDIPIELPTLDTENILIGLLMTALEFNIHDSEDGSPLYDRIKHALARMFPGYHNVGHIACPTCLDTGLVCSQCGCNPHTANCSRIKGIRSVKDCEAEGCETSPQLNEMRLRALCEMYEEKERELKELRERFLELEKKTSK